MFRGLFKIFKKRNKKYISEFDTFIQEFDMKNTSKSESQIQEIAKHRNIFNKKSNGNIKW